MLDECIDGYKAALKHNSCNSVYKIRYFSIFDDLFYT